ncbi:MAG: radical SAM protein [Phycisphaerales bacterium]|nr:radical SAM protein [Phycisphaerales bacterium]
MSVSLSILNGAQPIKTTRSRCPVCLAEIDASVFERGGGVFMTKRCEIHGDFETLLARDARFYYDSRGACGSGCGCASAEAGAARAATDPFDVLSTCVALIEIVDTCNLTCPTCFAASPLGVDERIECISFDEYVRCVEQVLTRKGFIDILQLSGGEPTIHPEFFRLLEWALQRGDIGYVLINTNGVRIARDGAFREQLGRLRQLHRKFELYLQFDGTQQAGQVELRGADLRALREQAIDLAGRAGVPTTLGMVVTEQTRRHLGEALRFGLERPHCRGITLQPMFGSGRVPAVETSLPMAGHAHEPISVGDVIVDLVSQSAGQLTIEDFTPLPCGDPNCHTMSYLIRTDSGPVGLSRFIDLASLQGFLSNRLDYRLEDLAQCGCESEPLGAVLKQLEIGPDQPFRIFIKPFMDAWTFDQDRIDRCCTHVIRRDGRLDSFCRYYLSGGRAAEAAGAASALR